MDNEKKIYFATKAFILKDGKFLVMHKANVEEEWWELPGGRMEFGESAEETLSREIMEETGLVVKPIKILDTWNLVRENYQIVGIIYLCDIEHGAVKLSEEHDMFKWMNINDTTVSEMHKVFKERMSEWDWQDIDYKHSEDLYLGFKDFLVEAKINTYAGGGVLSESSRPNSKDMHYSKGKYEYIDTYLGGINFIGEEAVYYDDKAVWGMNYYGEMLKGEGVPAGFSKCLKSALRTVPKEAPYRGPRIYDDGDFQYRCRWYGSIESFHGEEYISYKNTDIYKLRFHGGIIS